MLKHRSLRHAITYSLLFAGATGFVATALAAPPSDDGHTEANELSQEIDTYNQNRGSLKDDSAARAGTTTGNLNGSSADDSSAAGTERGHERADELSQDIDEYNQQGGSLNEPSAADSDLNHPATGTHGREGGHEEAESLSHELDEYNNNR